MSLKLQFLHSDSMEAINREHGERFYKNISAMEPHYYSQWNA